MSDEEMRDLVKDCGLDWHRGYMPLFDGDPTNRYAVLIESAVAAERERMIADGWRQTRYVAPVTDCEACLTPDACALRGQCGHYLRESPTGSAA